MQEATAQATVLQASKEEYMAGEAGSIGAPLVRCQIQTRCRRLQPPEIAASDPVPAAKLYTLTWAWIDAHSATLCLRRALQSHPISCRAEQGGMCLTGRAAHGDGGVAREHFGVPG